MHNIDDAKAFHCVDHNKVWEILKEMGIPDYLTGHLRNLYAYQESTVRTGHETIECERLDISSRKAETPREHFIQGSKCEMLGWMKHKLESKLPQEISVTSDMRMTPPLWQKVKN